MQQHRKEIEKYLKQLVNNLLYVKSLYKQLKIIKSWETPDRISALNIGSHFIGLTVFSFYRITLIEIYKLFAIDEDRTILDFLCKLKMYIKDVSPTQYNVKNSRTEKIDVKQYVRTINKQEYILASKIEVIERVKSLRDKITHSDKDYFNNPLLIFKKYSISDLEIDELLKVASKILKYHYSYIFESDLDMEIHSSSNIDSLLIYTRAFDRIWRNNDLDFVKYVYKLDEYNPKQ
jgi:hypothetical protein